MKGKKNIIIGVIALLSITSANSQTELTGIQKRIDDAFFESVEKGTDEITPIVSSLQGAGSEDDLLGKYWQAYGLYREGVMHLSIENRENAGAALDSAIKLLKNIENKDAEINALLATALSRTIVLDPGLAVVISSEADKYYLKSLKQDPDNLRAHLGLGRSDFYTPVQYGGGKEVEKYLLKALTLNVVTADYENAPSWGKEDCFYFLVRYYQREERIADAKLFCQKGLRKFPNSQRLQQQLQLLKD